MKRPELSHPRTLVWTAFWLVILLGLAEVLLRYDWPWRVESLQPYLVRDTRDDATYMAFLVQRLKTPPAPGTQRVLLFGGSAALYMVHDDPEVNRRLQAKSEAPIEYVRVASKRKTFLQSAQIVDALRDHLRGTTIIVPVNETRMVRPHARTDYHFLPIPKEVQPILDAEVVAAHEDRSRLSRSLAPLGQALKVRLTAATRLRPVATDYEATPPPLGPMGDEQLQLWHRQFNIMGRKPDERDRNHRMLEVLLDMATSAGAQVILLGHPHTPRHPRLEFTAEFRKRILALTGRPGVRYLDGRAPREFVAEDFWDFHHMIDEGREKFTDWFTDVVPTLLEPQ